ncbi:MAG: hypothetical protein Ta2A_08040 [Treponemataceae bacterium]|nr:MAG: hypothetical protein Ta2A_08040 [Treponemataceae bacterium]
MFENILYQNATETIKAEISAKQFPPAVLFSGPAASGKLSCALECARILSCKNNGAWNCTCASCSKHKILANNDIVLLGSRESSSEIRAADRAWQKAMSDQNGKQYIIAARFFLLRAVKKLLLKFTPEIWAGDAKLTKLSSAIEAINETCEDFETASKKIAAHITENALTLGDTGDFDAIAAKAAKIEEKLITLCEKLDTESLSRNIPVLHIRNIANAAKYRPQNGCKTIIIDNAENMQEEACNSLLKILEEPPHDTFFILLSQNHKALLPTILSRVRTYFFYKRSSQEQAEILTRIFHADADALRADATIENYLQQFLGESTNAAFEQGASFLSAILLCRENKKTFNIKSNLKNFLNKGGDFESFKTQKLFFEGMLHAAKNQSVQFQNEFCKKINECYGAITVYNIKPVSALEVFCQSPFFRREGAGKSA